MSNRIRRARKGAAGFTLLEMSVTVLIMGILASLAISTMSDFSKRATPQNAAFDFSAMLSKARGRAQQRNSNVWVVVYPNKRRTTGPGPGAYFVFDDPDAELAATYKAGFFNPEGTLPGRVKRLEAVYFEDYGRGEDVGFCYHAADVSGAAPTLPPPYDSLTVFNNCSFCNGSPSSMGGAIVFRAEGGALFLNNYGIPATPNTGPAGNTAIVTLCSKSAKVKQTYMMAISGLTGFVGVFRK